MENPGQWKVKGEIYHGGGQSSWARPKLTQNVQTKITHELAQMMKHYQKRSSDAWTQAMDFNAKTFHDGTFTAWSSRDRSTYGTGNALTSPHVLADVLLTAVRGYLKENVETTKWERDINPTQLSILKDATTIGKGNATANQIVAYLIRKAIIQTDPTRLSCNSADHHSWAGLFDGSAVEIVPGGTGRARGIRDDEPDLRSLLMKTHQLLASKVE